MAEAKGKGESAGGTQTKTVGLGIRLVPVGDSDQPIVANYTSITAAPGMAFLDFGFIEPGTLAALPRVAREGGKLPETINGRLAARIALSYEALAGLHQQTGKLLGDLKEAAGRAAQKKS